MGDRDDPFPSAIEALVSGQPQVGTATRAEAAGRADHDLFRELMDRFTLLAETCARFSQAVYQRAGTPPESDMPGTIDRNLKIARTVFEKWSLDIMAVAYFNKAIRFTELRRALGKISAPLLRSKLRKLERMGLLQSDVVTKRRPERRYNLTHKGMMIAKLGEPVFLYLRLADGWKTPEDHEGQRDAEEHPISAAIGSA